MKLVNHSASRSRTCSALTLIEMMFSILIGTLIIAAALQLFIYASRVYTSFNNYDQFNRQSRHALDEMLSDIRQCHHLIGYSSNSIMQQLIFTNMPGSTVGGFSYTYQNGALIRTWGTDTSILVTNLSSLAFNLSQRNPSNNFTFYPATSPTLTKLINVTWVCSLPVYGSELTNTESIQTANIVIRN